MFRRNLYQIRGSIATNDENILVDSKLFAIATPHIQPNRPRTERLYEGLDNRPRLVPGRGEVRGDLLVDFVDVLLLVPFRCDVLLRGHCNLSHRECAECVVESSSSSSFTDFQQLPET